MAGAAGALCSGAGVGVAGATDSVAAGAVSVVSATGGAVVSSVDVVDSSGPLSTGWLA